MMNPYKKYHGGRPWLFKTVFLSAFVAKKGSVLELALGDGSGVGATLEGALLGVDMTGREVR